MTEGHTERLEAALAGRYRIERKLGEGGMASVYLAEDLKHERKVALKILRPELAAVIGAERFLSEIKTTANLQHPHILALFDSGSADGYLYYVMPFIEGETLREKLDREKQLGVEEAVQIARDVADALDYAHRHGVIHRDIKPGNILLHDGRPVVADFGIALAVSAAGGGRMTETGLSLGTPHYMSPEQASADRDLSVRSDVYSLGCVLYEMLAGQPPHTGPSAQSILVRILTEDPRPLAQLRHTVPPNVAAAVAKSIEKLPADRFESAKDFQEALDDAAFVYQPAPKAGTGAAPQPLTAAAPRRPAHVWLEDRRSVAALVGGLAFAVLAAWGWLRPTPEAPPSKVTRFTFTPPATAPISTRGSPSDIAVSRDGRLIAYAGPNSGPSGPQINLRALDELAAVPLRGSDFGQGPFFSPDGAWVGFSPTGAVTTLQRVSVLGGSPVILTEAPSMIHGASWGQNDEIVFGTMVGGLFRVLGGGGEPEQLTTPDPEQGDIEHVWPDIIDGRNAVVFTIVGAGSQKLAVLDMESGSVKGLGLEGSYPRYVATGHLVYAAEDGSLRAVPFDVESLSVTGTTVPIIEGITVKGAGSADFDVSDDGELVYLSGTGVAGGIERTVLWVDRAAREETVDVEPRGYTYARLSPDGTRLALDNRPRGATASESIWIWDFAAGNSTRLIIGGGTQMYQLWTPDGRRLAYSDPSSPDLFWKAANNTGEPEVLVGDVKGEGSQHPEAYFFTPDGKFVVLRQQAIPDRGDDLIMVEVGGDGEPIWRLGGNFDERNAVLSPDGRWMAYQSDESGRFEVYVRPFPDVDQDQVLVSSSGGFDPLFSRDGRELFYLQPGSPPELISVPVGAIPEGERFQYRARQSLLAWPYSTDGEGRNYDVSLDGQRFVVLKDPGSDDGSVSLDITVVLNWFEELKQRMGT